MIGKNYGSEKLAGEAPGNNFMVRKVYDVFHVAKNYCVNYLSPRPKQTKNKVVT